MIERNRYLSPGLAWSLALGRVARWVMPTPMMRRVISGYVRFYGVELGDVSVPEGGWPTLGSFFVRELRSGARPVDQTPDTLTSPCDGVVQAAGRLEGGRFVVKGRPYRAQELMGREGWWSEGERSGGAVVIYLSPADYHRVHSPTAGRVRGIWRISGSSYPVNRLGRLLVPWAVVRNERVVYELEDRIGPLAVVMVGALGVRAIGVNEGLREQGGDSPLVERGSELGVFHLGSTVVLLWSGRGEPLVGVGERVYLGQRVVAGRRP